VQVTAASERLSCPGTLLGTQRGWATLLRQVARTLPNAIDTGRGLDLIPESILRGKRQRAGHLVERAGLYRADRQDLTRRAGRKRFSACEHLIARAGPLLDCEPFEQDSPRDRV
jgi:hypothetical protein